MNFLTYYPFCVLSHIIILSCKVCHFYLDFKHGIVLLKAYVLDTIMPSYVLISLKHNNRCTLLLKLHKHNSKPTFCSQKYEHEIVYIMLTLEMFEPECFRMFKV